MESQWQKIESFNSKLDSLNPTKLRNENVQLKQEIEKMRNELGVTKNDISKLRNKIQERDLRVEALEENVRLAYDLKDTAEKQAEELRKQLADTKLHEQLKDAELKNLDHRVNDLESHIFEKSQELLQAQDANNQLKREIEAMKNSNGINEHKLEELQDSIKISVQEFSDDNNQQLIDSIIVSIMKTINKIAGESQKKTTQAHDPHKPSINDVYSEAYISNLKNQIEIWKDKYKKKSEDIAHQQKEMEVKLAEIQKEHNAIVNQKDEELEKTKKALLAREKGNYEQLYKELQQRNVQLVKNMKDAENDKAKTDEINHTLRDQLRKLEDDVKVLELSKEELDEKSQMLQKKIEELEAEIENRNITITSLKDAAKKNNETIASVSTKVSTLKEEKKELTNRVAELEKRVSELEKQAEANTSQIKELEKDKAELQKKLADETKRLKQEKETVIVQFESEISEIKVNHERIVETLNSQIQRSNESQESSKQELKESLMKVATLESTIVGLEITVKQRTQEIESIKESNAESASKLEKQLADNIVELEALRTEKQTFDEKIAELNRKIEELDSESKANEKKYNLLIKDLRKQLSQERKDQGKPSPPDLPPRKLQHEVSSNSLHSESSEDHVHEKMKQLRTERSELLHKLEVSEQNLQMMQVDNEAKSKIIQDLMLRERIGIKDFNPDHHQEKQAPSSPLSFVKKMAHVGNSHQLETTMEANKKLQVVLEETLMRNLQLQEIVKKMGEEIQTLKDHKK